jgi:hypothetical protein
MRSGLVGWVILLGVVSFAVPVSAEKPAERPALTVCQLVHMCREELDTVYQGGTAPTSLSGKVRGTAIPSPGSSFGPARSKATKAVWQGKVFDSCCGTATNKFFGLRAVKANVCTGESWMDGKPALILDYSQTSLVYRDVRDEIREVAPGLYLGAMYEDHCCGPRLKMYFVLEAPSCCTPCR